MQVNQDYQVSGGSEEEKSSEENDEQIVVEMVQCVVCQAEKKTYIAFDPWEGRWRFLIDFSDFWTCDYCCRCFCPACIPKEKDEDEGGMKRVCPKCACPWCWRQKGTLMIHSGRKTHCRNCNQELENGCPTARRCFRPCEGRFMDSEAVVVSCDQKLCLACFEADINHLCLDCQRKDDVFF